MKRTVNFVLFFDLLFILLLAVSGSISGIGGNIVYYLAFIVPFVIFIAFAKREGLKSIPLRLKISKENILISALTLAPALAVVFFISWLTSLLTSGVGTADTVDVSGNIFYLIFSHALVPSVLEELFFRYLPIKYISPYSRKFAVLVSAACFSLVHCSVYQIPYAFAAGIIFAVIDIMSDSILPSIVFHFLNNTVSLIWLKYITNEKLTLIFLSVMAVLVLVSLGLLLIKRKVYLEKIKQIFSDKTRLELSYVFVIFLAVTLLAAVINL